MNKPVIYFLTLILISTSFRVHSGTEEKTKLRSSIALRYVKLNDSISLEVKLTYQGVKGDTPLPGEEIIFFAGTVPKPVGTSLTDGDGLAILKIDDRSKIQPSPDGSWAFRSEFSGKDSIDAVTADVAVKDINIEMTLALEDSVKTVIVKVYSSENGKKVPVKGETVSLFVPRMFSNLVIGDIKLDENGSGKFKFPSDIPGDRGGNLHIVAGLIEHSSYGTVEARSIEKWGVPTSYSIPVVHRALWTKTPPMWMIVTLSILLTGVWGHYMFAVISLILIRIDAKRKKAKEENGL